MPLTTTWRNNVGNHLIGKTSIAALADLWLALLTGNPTDAGLTTTEVTESGYGRVNITSLMGSFADSGLGYSEAVNTSLISFGVPAAHWGGGALLAYVGCMTASTAGTMKYYEESPNPRTALSGSRVVRFRPGTLKIRHY